MTSDSTPTPGTDATPSHATTPATPFHALDAYIALPRVSGLRLSPDGTRLVTDVATLDPDRTRYGHAVWEVDPAGDRPARRLTRSAKGETGATFTAAGDLLFTSARPDPDVKPDDDAPAALWLLPAGGGEARVVATRKAGIDAVAAATAALTVLVTSEVLPGAADEADDERRRTARSEHKVAAILHSGYPIRYWDHDLGPGTPHLFVADLATLAGTATTGRSATTATAADATMRAAASEPRLALRDVIPDAGAALVEQHSAISPDGRTVVTAWQRLLARAELHSHLEAVDVATGERRTLLADAGAHLDGPVVSPDGHRVAFLRETVSTPERAPRVTLGIVDLDGGQAREVATGWDRWPASIVWTPDSRGLLVTADDDGRSPVFHVALGSGPADDVVTRVTSDDAAFSDVCVSPDGTTAYALRASYLAPAHPVRIDLAAALAGAAATVGTTEVGAGESAAPVRGAGVPAVALPAPAAGPALPGRLVDVETTAADGTRVRSWLALPGSASPADPAPLLLWIHGGPLGSWNAWSWRWNPWLMVAQGYAVLLPDPALSTGYGQDFVQRGWGAWGAAPFTDLMAATDAAVAREDVDASRTAAMGGSFGGYMANWVAGHTDRFAAIVTHASLWALDQFGPTTDVASYWRHEMTPAMAEANSPHRFVDRIRTPMLVVHGDKDYRVPIGEGLRLWYELLAGSGLPADDEGRSPHRFLYFPDENHWVLTPQHAKVWYQVVGAFLAEHVLGEQGVLPDVLG